MDIEDDKLKKDFDKLPDSAKIDVLWEYILKFEDIVFNNQQYITNFEKQTEITLTEEERLQRKDVWDKQEFCSYFKVSDKTFERWKKKGEIPVKPMGGKDFVVKAQLKDRFNRDLLNDTNL